MAWLPSAHAHDGLANIGPVIVGGFVGLLAGVGLLTWWAARGASAGGGSALRRVLAGVALLPVCVVAGAVIAGMVAQAQHAAGNRAALRDQAAYRESELTKIACSAAASPDDAKLQALARSEPVILVEQVVRNCTVSGAAVPPPLKLQRFELLSTTLAARLPGLTTAADTPESWCHVLHAVHEEAAVDHLRALHRHKLPIVCRTKGQEEWGLAVSQPVGWIDPRTDGKKLDFYVFAAQVGAPLGKPFGREGRSLLQRVVRCHDPRLAQLALQGGADPALPDPQSNWSPRVHWLLRLHAAPGSHCAVDRWGDEATVLGDIRARIGKAGADELNRGYEGNGQSPLWEVFRPEDRSVNVPMLEELLVLGARPDHRNWQGDTFLQHARVLDAATLEAIGRQPADVLRAMGQVKVTVYDANPVPLAQAARKRGDEALAQLLCRHGAAGCG